MIFRLDTAQNFRPYPAFFGHLVNGNTLLDAHRLEVQAIRGHFTVLGHGILRLTNARIPCGMV
jgi:hypothetical protein